VPPANAGLDAAVESPVAQQELPTEQDFDVIVVGGGHAGCEAALAAARVGARTLLLTQSIDALGQMSCNPAIGGIGKGHLVREVDALGGLMGRAADACGIQFRTLNASKGAAVRATRAQIDRELYRGFVRRSIQSQRDLFVFQQTVEDLVLRDDHVCGVVTQLGLTLRAPCVVLTVGTFLGGRIHVGERNHAGGRAGDPAASVLAQRLRARPFRVGRLKTGTPPRLDGRSVDRARLREQPGDVPLPRFSFDGEPGQRPRQVSCWITRTNPRTHEIIRAGLDRSPLFVGAIDGAGPRYCPSVEDKVVRFTERDSHQIFLEPEGLNTSEVYPNGISTSLPYDVQLALVRSIEGLEQAFITRPGYAIEYDFFDPRELQPSLQTRHVGGLFFAGQINGTTGYEEAAAQGLVAGLNAARLVAGQEAWWPRRHEAYIGVLIDDLITMGATEPYRMFTSRAEYRLQLREDNADLRLREQALALGLVDAGQAAATRLRRTAIDAERARLRGVVVRPHEVPTDCARRLFGGPLSREQRAEDLLRRPGVSYQALMTVPGVGPGVDDTEVARQVETEVRYQGYVERQGRDIERARRNESTTLPESIDYDNVIGLSTEVREALSRHRPATLGQAARIAGVTPAAVSLLMVHLKR
jgi:tRNA uridine 5-carboxymethylaminomethyl modification enzyme